MRKTLDKYFDCEHRTLVPDKSVVRYADVMWVYHGAWIDPENGKIKVLLSAFKNGKMRLVHDRHRKDIELEYTMA